VAEIGAWDYAFACELLLRRFSFQIKNPRAPRGFFVVFTGGKTAAVTGTIQIDAEESLTARFGQSEPATGILVGCYGHPRRMSQAGEQAESI